MTDSDVTIVIPIYNAASHLAETLDSILTQEGASIDVVCVDDGSTDGSPAILPTYERRDPRLTVLHQANSGSSAARNLGLSQASGAWVCFVDADDLLAPGALSLLTKALRTEADIVYFDHLRFSTQVPSVRASASMPTRTFDGDDIRKLQSDCINRFASNTPLIPDTVLPTPWAKIYRREFLIEHDLCFRSGLHLEEDVLFNFEALSYCERAVYIGAVLYLYRVSIASMSHHFDPSLVSSVRRSLAAFQDVITRRYPDRDDIHSLYRYRVLWDLLYCVVLGPIHIDNPGRYQVRRRQFLTLIDDPLFADALCSLSTTRFKLRQSVLATLIKHRMFWFLDVLGRTSGRLRSRTSTCTDGNKNA